MKRIIMLAILAVGCSNASWESETTCDKEAEKVVFIECMKNLPKGPERLTAAGNDWDSVDNAVEACQNAASHVACTTKYHRVVRKWNE